jgi:hypothetical protein
MVPLISSTVSDGGVSLPGLFLAADQSGQAVLLRVHRVVSQQAVGGKKEKSKSRQEKNEGNTEKREGDKTDGTQGTNNDRKTDGRGGDITEEKEGKSQQEGNRAENDDDITEEGNRAENDDDITEEKEDKTEEDNIAENEDISNDRTELKVVMVSQCHLPPTLPPTSMLVGVVVVQDNMEGSEKEEEEKEWKKWWSKWRVLMVYGNGAVSCYEICSHNHVMEASIVIV